MESGCFRSLSRYGGYYSTSFPKVKFKIKKKRIFSPAYFSTIGLTFSCETQILISINDGRGVWQ